MAENAARVTQDLVRDRKASFLLWGLPALLMIATGPLGFSPELHGSIWASCLSVFGFGCLANVRRCGRRHCFFTGPFFLAMALVSLVYGFGVISLGSYGWGWIGGITLVGACALTILPERIWGRYACGGGESDGGHCG